jgi:UDP-N-acetylmuramate: L-alanyl-gamma-D-glutamyl-meso-diaminopimelate ligase
MLPAAFAQVITVGTGAEVQWRACDLQIMENGTRFSVLHDQKPLGSFFVPLHGVHNVKNAVAVLAAAHALGISFEKTAAALQSFKNVRRRLQLLYDQNGVKVFDDFAHHPTEIRETIAAVKQRFPQQRLWTIFEPRSATSKRKIFEQEYLQAFREAQGVVLAPIHRPDKVPEAERLSLSTVVEGIRAHGSTAEIMPTGEEMADYLLRHTAPGDIVLFMSNGDFGGTPALLINKLKAGAR